MAPRATWKGFLNLSLVSVPVKAFSANDSSGSIRLNQLHAACHSRINLKTICPTCGDVPRSDILKGYEYAKGQYVIVDLEELEKLRTVDESKAIRIEQFVPPDAIDPLHFSESSYYLLPDGVPGQKPFVLLREAMQEKGLVCVARVILHNREQLVQVRPLGPLLCMTILRYLSQIKPVALFEDELAQPEISSEERKLAETLITETTAEEFHMENHSDQYTERLTRLIESKVEGKELVTAPDVEVAPMVDLMAALKASLDQVQPSPRRATQEKAARQSPRPAAEELLAEQLAQPPKKRAKNKKTPKGKKSAG